MILVTGASGQIGSAVIQQLLKLLPAGQIAGLSRSESKAEALKAQGIDARLGDYNDLDSLKRAMQGIEKVLLVSGGQAENGLQQHHNVVDAAKSKGVKCIAYTGRSLQNREQLINQLMLRHFETEDYIRASGLQYVLFRNSLYMDVIPGYVGKQFVQTGVHLPDDGGKVAFALRREMGEAIANVLASGDCQNRIYQFTGSQTWTFAEVAAALSELAGEPVSYTAISQEQYQANLKAAGLPEGVIQLLSAFLADIAQEQEATVTSELEAVLGRKPVGLKEGLKEMFSF